MSTIPEAMKKDLTIKYNTACVGLKYSDSGVDVTTREVSIQSECRHHRSTGIEI